MAHPALGGLRDRRLASDLELLHGIVVRLSKFPLTATTCGAMCALAEPGDHARGLLELAAESRPAVLTRRGRPPSSCSATWSTTDARSTPPAVLMGVAGCVR